MLEMYDEARAELAIAWAAFARKFSVDLQAPAKFSEADSNRTISVAAYIPHFGSKDGVVVDVIFGPGYRPDPRLSRFQFEGIKPHLCYINIDLIADEYLIEALEDFGWFGESDRLPHIMRGTNIILYKHVQN